MRHFNVLCVPKPSAQVLTLIFESILGGYLSRLNFKTEIQALTRPIVDSTIGLYAGIKRSLLPIPAKSHYTFNLRDISKVFQGLLMCSANTAKTKDMFIRLWIHEAMRCFHDRLINDEDRAWFCEAVGEALVKTFKVGHSPAFAKEEIFDT